MNYIDKTKPVASSRIIPWLKPEKYSFCHHQRGQLLDIMRETKDVDAYKRLLEKLCPENSEKTLAPCMCRWQRSFAVAPVYRIAFCAA